MKKADKDDPHKGKLLIPREEEQHIKYQRLLEHARREGRIDGPFSCSTCGSRYLSKDQADRCCHEL